MCWRERFLTLRSSLITYTGKEFVYVIIFSISESCDDSSAARQPPSPAPRSPAKGCSAPATGPAPAPRQTRQLPSPCANSLSRKRLRWPQMQPPLLGLRILPMVGGHPRSRRAPYLAAGTTSHPVGRVGSRFGSEG